MLELVYSLSLHVANTSGPVPRSLRSSGSPLSAPSDGGSDAVSGREGRVLNPESSEAGPVMEDCVLNQPRAQI